MATATANIINIDQPDALERAIETAIYRKIVAQSPWRKVLRVVQDPGNVAHSEDMPRLSHWVSRPAWTYEGPSDWPSVVWVPTDGSAPGSVTTPTLGTSTVSAYEAFSYTVFSREAIRDARAIVDAAAGQAPDGTAMVDLIADLLAGALLREEDRVIVNGAGSTTDPVLGLDQITAISSVAAGADLLDSIVGMISTLRRAKREPNAVVVGPSVEEALRKLKDSAGLRVFPPNEPIVISGVPVVVSWSIPASATNAKLYVGDFTGVVLFERLFGPSRPIAVRIDEHGLFTTDRVRVRAAMRLGLAAIPGLGVAGIRRLTGIAAP